jgi:HAE1 family hydrophobic/amphiphilic exporter-1
MRIAELCVKRPVFAVMLISFLVVLGIFSFRDLGVDLFPKADPAVVTVTVTLKGATPEEVNTQIVLPLEEAISTISGMDEMTSSASEGTSRISCKFNLERNINGAAQDVREKVAAAIHLLPPNIDPPVIVKVDPDQDAVLTMLVGGTGSLREITEVADKQVRRALETVNGVGAVGLTGGRLRQVRVFADAEKLSAFGITIKQLETAIQKENVEVPGGTVRQGRYELGLRTLGRIESPAQFNDIIVANVNGAPIRVRDVGTVEDSYPENTSWSMLHGKEAVVLSVQRQFGANTLDVIQGVKSKLEQIKSALPPGNFIEIIRDNSRFIKASVASLEEHLLFGSVLASLVVLLFLRNWRSVLIAALAIPTSIIATFTLLRIMNFTLNNLTLLGLTLAVGIVIDDAIVVLENIVRYIEEKGFAPRQAAIEATREIMLAVMATTLSLVIIFVPIAFTTGFARRYLNQFGWTMAFAVIVSMVVSLTLTPMLASRLLKRIGGRRREAAPSNPGFFRWIDRGYGKMLEWSLNHRLVVISVGLGTFALTFLVNGRVGRDFIPADDQNEFQAIIDTPVDSSLEHTIAVDKDLVSRYEKVPGVVFAWPTIGERGEYHSHTYLRLTPSTERSFTFVDVADQIRKIWADPRFKDLRPRFWFPSALGGSENTGSIQPIILGPDFNRVAALASQEAGKIRRIKGLLDVSAEINLNSPEFQVQIDRQRAADLGVQISDVADAVRLMIAGTDQISTYKEGAEQYDVNMQLLREQQKNPLLLARLMVPSTRVGQVRLDSIATIHRRSGPTRIDRYNRTYQAGIIANQAPDMPLDVAVRAISSVIRKDLPPGYTVRFTGTAKELDRTTNDLISAFLLACIFMYMVLASQFESFLHPFVIMLALPLSIPCALLTLYLTHRTLNLWSALGMLLLLGIVKKNGILQVDYTNRLLAQGIPLREAILQANHVRLRPILMTTTSIVAGLMPTALGFGAGGTQRAAIAVTIIGGQSLCLLLTLLVTPVAYSLFAGMERTRILAPLEAGMARLRLGMARVFMLHLR